MLVASIDLMDGKAVQLRQGNPSEKALEENDPLSLARYFDGFGPIAVIDLDQALGQGDNLALIKQLCKLAECTVGGGVKTVERAKELIQWGAVKVIVGSKAFENDSINHEFLAELRDAIGPDQIQIAIDARDGRITTKGWKHDTGLDVYEVAPELEQYCRHLLFTVVQKEGMMEGTDMEAISRLREVTSLEITAAGGVSMIDEAVALAALDIDVQIGMALYTKKITLEEGFVSCLNWRKTDLIPTIAQDEDGQVIMMAYSNRESLEKTLETGSMHYWSRTRAKLWMKGETSGHTQELVRLRADCDRDTILATIRQTRVGCHTGSYSCFGPRRFSLSQLHRVIGDRFASPPPGTYTAKLKDPELLHSKIAEEAGELIEATGREEIVWEAADVIYFTLAKLAVNGIGLDEVVEELAGRRRGPRRD